MNTPTVTELSTVMGDYGEATAKFCKFTVEIEQDAFADDADIRKCRDGIYIANYNTRYNLGDSDGLSELAFALGAMVEEAGAKLYPHIEDFSTEDQEIPCPHCNVDNDPDSEGCGHCIGGYIMNQYYVCPHDSYPLQIQTMLDFDIDYRDRLAIRPVYLYDHSGIAISCAPFSCRWDSGQIGWVFTTPQEMRFYMPPEWEDFSNPECRRLAERFLIEEVEHQNNFIQGNVYGWRVLDDEGEEVESCWGYVGDHNQSGLFESVAGCLQNANAKLLAAQQAQRRSYYNRLKALIRHHVPYTTRNMLVAQMKPEGL